MHGDLPSLYAPLRVAGRGRGWGVYQLAPLAASLLRHPPPPTPPHRFAGGGEELFAMTGCLKIESPPSSSGLTGRSSIPETPAVEPMSRGVLDPPHARGMTIGG
jgi:hypothetical protein